MTRRIPATLTVLAGLTIFGLAPAAAQTADQIEAHLAAAKKAAGFDFAGTLVRTCVAPQTGPGADVAPGPAPDRASYATEPAKVFDNLYFVGTKIHSSWALTTSAGIILIDRSTTMPRRKRSSAA
jgi:metallo-beta-lactamase class B